MTSGAVAKTDRTFWEPNLFGNVLLADRKSHTASLPAPRSRQLQSAARGSSRSDQGARSCNPSAPIFLRQESVVETTEWLSQCPSRPSRSADVKSQFRRQ